MMPLVSGLLEPMSECIPVGLYAAWAFYHFLGINPYVFFSIHLGAWLVSDYLLLRMNQVKAKVNFCTLARSACCKRAGALIFSYMYVIILS